jgi:hypothetical protein
VSVRIRPAVPTRSGPMAIRYRQKTSSLRGRLEQGSNPARMPQLVRILCRSSSNGQEHPSLKRDDVGSHPTGGTNPAHVAQSLAEARGSDPRQCGFESLREYQLGSVAQIWRAPALQAGGCGCDACQIHHGPSSSRLRTAASQAANRGSKPRGPTNAGRGWCPGRAHTLVLEGSIPSSATNS